MKEDLEKNYVAINSLKKPEAEIAIKQAVIVKNSGVQTPTPEPEPAA